MYVRQLRRPVYTEAPTSILSHVGSPSGCERIKVVSHPLKRLLTRRSVKRIKTYAASLPMLRCGTMNLAPLMIKSLLRMPASSVKPRYAP